MSYQLKTGGKSHGLDNPHSRGNLHRPRDQWLFARRVLIARLARDRLRERTACAGADAPIARRTFFVRTKRVAPATIDRWIGIRTLRECLHRLPTACPEQTS